MNRILHSRKSAFTIVELLVVIVVIGILAAVSTLGFGAWRHSLAEKEVQTDLKTALNTMEQTKNFGEGYPSSIPANFKSSPNVTVTYISGDLTTFCIEATSNIYDDISYYVSESTTEPTEGTCTGGPGGGGDDDGGGDIVVAQISAGGDHACLLTPEGEAYCWGSNEQGQLGIGVTGGTRDTPVAISMSGVLAGKTIKQISAGMIHTCAIASDDKAYCWGVHSDGLLGAEGNVSSNVPIAVSTSGALSGKSITQITVGSRHTCVIASDGKAYCWGNDAEGRLGKGSTGGSALPVAVSMSGALAGKTVKQISAGASHTCAVASDDKAYCWGSLEGLGAGWYYGDTTVPVPVSTSGVLAGKTIRQISASVGNSTCVIASDDKAYCWGLNGYGEIGNGTFGSQLTPVAVDTSGVLSGKSLTAIEVGYSHTCTVDTGGKAYCWGAGGSGQLGSGSTGAFGTPLAVYTSSVLSGKDLVQISTGNLFTCGIDSEDNAYCWGSNTSGQLGDNKQSGSGSTVPVVVAPY